MPYSRLLRLISLIVALLCDICGAFEECASRRALLLCLRIGGGLYAPIECYFQLNIYTGLSQVVLAICVYEAYTP